MTIEKKLCHHKADKSRGDVFVGNCDSFNSELNFPDVDIYFTEIALFIYHGSQRQDLCKILIEIKM